MRVLVVDQDSALLTAITRLLGEYFAIDAVTTKADALDLVRVNEFDVIVAGERLEDGSGLELLGQMGRSRPDMLRIFAVERERRKLLKGRLGPFALFRTLSYPIEPRQLLAALSAAAGIEEEFEDVEAEEAAPPEPSPPPAPPASRAPVAPPMPLEPVEVTVRAVRQQPPPTPARAMVQAPEPRARREVHDFTLVDEEPSPPPEPRSRKGSKSRSSARTSNSTSARNPRQPTPEALAVGSRLAAAARAKALAPPLLEPDAKRSAFLVGAGVFVVIGVMAVALHVFTTNDTPTFSTARPSSHDPPEVVRLVADTETAFQKDDYKTARTDITALQQISPTHPRLPFFEALLAKHEAILLNSPPPPSSPLRLFSRHTSPPPKTNSAPPPPHSSGTTLANRTPGPAPLPSVNTRARPGAQTSVYSSTFSGKTLEDSNGSGSASVVTRDAEIVKRVDAEYPPDAAKKGIEGAVDLSFMVSTTGEVRDVTVVRAEPSSIFDRSAIAAVRRFRYRPRTVDGMAVESRVQLHMAFKLDGH